jgi:hypothetical protein
MPYEARVQRLLGRLLLAAGLAGLPLTAWLTWYDTRDYPDAWGIEWYDKMFLNFPEN